jgi:hypothetical protein
MAERFLTLNEAARILRLKDRRTVIQWARQGRLRIVGERRHLLVVAASIDEYEHEESQWHYERSQSAANQTPAQFDTSQGGIGRGKPRSRSGTDSTDMILSLPGQKLKRI